MAGRWCAYLLWCSDGSLYAGATNDLAARLSRHNAGTGARYTRSRGPVRLARVFYRASRSDALRSEAALKRLSRSEKLELATLKKMRAPRLAKRGIDVAKRADAPGRSGSKGAKTRRSTAGTGVDQHPWK